MEARKNKNRAFRWVLILLMCLYAIASVLPFIWPQVPRLSAISAQILLPALFVLIHGSLVYGIRGMLVFTCIAFVVGNIFENLGIRTGFPFGSYYFTEIMGPKLLGVPLLMGPAYLAIGYTSWMIGHIILGRAPRALATPLLAAMIAVSWDVSADPIWSTVSHFWVWRHGGPFFGVAVTNFFGWFLTNYLIFQLFALYLSRRSNTGYVPVEHWRLGVASYLVVIAVSLGGSGALLGRAQIPDATGRQWITGHIAMSSAAVSLFLMGGFGALAFWRLVRQPARATGYPASELEHKAVAN